MPTLRRNRAVFVAVLCTVVSAWALCGTGSAAADPPAAPTTPDAPTTPAAPSAPDAPAALSAPAAPTGGTPVPQVIPPTTGASGYGEPGTQSLIVHPIAVLGRRLVARGTLPGAARDEVILQRLDPRRGWRNVARSRVHTTERFELRWRADRSGRISLRAIVNGARRTAAAAPAPIANVTVYRPSMATYYGPGFFGNQTACGQMLTPELLGVAHRRLPCGALVAVTYAGREIVVPVIDRGPFNAGYSWDLTQATADALGFAGSGEIGYTRVEPAAPAAPAQETS
jgi:rare lipoprotein A